MCLILLTHSISLSNRHLVTLLLESRLHGWAGQKAQERLRNGRLRGALEQDPGVRRHELQVPGIRADQFDLRHRQDLADLGQADRLDGRFRHQLHRNLAAAGRPDLLAHLLPDAQTVRHLEEVGTGGSDLRVGVVDLLRGQERPFQLLRRPDRRAGDSLADGDAAPHSSQIGPGGGTHRPRA